MMMRGLGMCGAVGGAVLLSRSGLGHIGTSAPVATSAQCAAKPPNPKQVTLSRDLRQRVLAVNTAALADADKEGLRVMDARLRPIRPGQPFVGVARTVRCFNDFLTVIKGLAESVPGEVLVIDTQQSTRTVVGELFGTESKRRGLEAIVLDGPCRDTAQLAEMDLPVHITGVRPISGTANKIYATQVAVQCGGVVVEPGDVVIGDDDGIVVCSVEQLKTILPAAEAIVAAEEQLLQGMKAGVPLLDQLNFDEHYAAVARGDHGSKLQFKGGQIKA